MSRSFGSSSLTTRLPILIWPALMVSRPAIILSKVDFPQPDGPTRMTNSPSSMSTLTPCRMGTAPKDLRTCSICTDDIAASPLALLAQPDGQVRLAGQLDAERRLRLAAADLAAVTRRMVPRRRALLQRRDLHVPGIDEVDLVVAILL